MRVTSPGRVIATLSLACVCSLAGRASAGLISEDLAAISVSSVDAMAISLDPNAPSVETGSTESGDNQPAGESTGTPGLPSPGSGQQQMLIAKGGTGGSSMPDVQAPHFKRKRNNARGPGGPGSGNGSGNSGTSGLGSNGSSSGLSSTGSSGNSGSGGSGGPSSGTGSSSGDSGAGSSGNSAPAPGTDVSNPLMPSSTSGSTYSFNTNVPEGSPLFADPPLATGFIFTANPGSPDFTSVEVTTPLPNTTVLSITYDGQTSQFAPGTTFTFPDPVSTFHVFGISPTDVASGADFETKLTFNGSGNVSFTETANPEPGSLTLLALGGCAVMAARRRKNRRA